MVCAVLEREISVPSSREPRLSGTHLNLLPLVPPLLVPTQPTIFPSSLRRDKQRTGASPLLATLERILAPTLDRPRLERIELLPRQVPSKRMVAEIAGGEKMRGERRVIELVVGAGAA